MSEFLGQEQLLTVEEFDEYFAAAGIEYKPPQFTSSPSRTESEQYSQFLGKYLEPSSFNDLKTEELRLLAYDVAVYQRVTQSSSHSARNLRRQHALEELQSPVNETTMQRRQQAAITLARTLRSMQAEPGADWTEEARCLDADPVAFFPKRGVSNSEAKRLCAQCPVQQECLEYALENKEQFGIWGGMSERERKRLVRLNPPVAA